MDEGVTVSRIDMLHHAAAWVDDLADRYEIDPRMAPVLMGWLDAVLRDGQPTPQIGYNEDGPMLEATWLVGGIWGTLSAYADGDWDFWTIGTGSGKGLDIDGKGVDGPQGADLERVVALLDEMGKGVRYRVPLMGGVDAHDEGVRGDPGQG